MYEEWKLILGPVEHQGCSSMNFFCDRITANTVTENSNVLQETEFNNKCTFIIRDFYFSF